MKKKNFAIFSSLMFAVLLANSPLARAATSGVALLPALRYSSAETTTNTSTKSTMTEIGLTLGYLMDSGLLLGATYASTAVSVGSSTTVNTTGYGPTIGYLHDSGFIAMFHYILSLTEKTTVSGADVTDTGDGMKFDVGYLFKLGSSAMMGPTLSYFNYTYKKRKIANAAEVDINPAEKHTDMWLPGLQFAFIF